MAREVEKKRNEEYERQKFEILAEEMERIKEGRKLVYSCLPAIIPTLRLSDTHTHTQMCEVVKLQLAQLLV